MAENLLPIVSIWRYGPWPVRGADASCHYGCEDLGRLRRGKPFEPQRELGMCSIRAHAWRTSFAFNIEPWCGIRNAWHPMHHMVWSSLECRAFVWGTNGKANAEGQTSTHELRAGHKKYFNPLFQKNKLTGGWGYIYICVYLYIYIYTNICIDTHKYTYTHIYILHYADIYISYISIYYICIIHTYI